MTKRLSATDIEAGSDGGIFALRGNLDGEKQQDFVEREQFIGVMIGTEEFLIPISSVDEILMLPPITWVPQGPRFVDGVVNLRGSIVPAINLRKMMGIEKGKLGASTRIVIVQELDLRVGILVDAITYVVALPPDQIESPKLAGKGSGADLICGISKHDNKVTGILHLAVILHTAAGGKLADLDSDTPAAGDDAHQDAA